MTTGELVKLMLKFYRENKLLVRPERNCWISGVDQDYPNVRCSCCGLGAAYLAMNGGVKLGRKRYREQTKACGGIPVRPFFVEKGIPSDWISGFQQGFDNGWLDIDPTWSADFKKGFLAGRAVAKKVFETEAITT